MEKLSGIIPSNARVKSVDMDAAPPARPGAPAMGRREGRNTVKDRVSLSAKAREMAAAEFNNTAAVKNPKEAAQSKMVEEISRKFFENRVKPVEVPLSEQVSHSLPSVEQVLEHNTSLEKPEGVRVSE